MDWDNVRITLTGLAIQAMLERDSSWESKVISDVFYKTFAKHCVRIADACVEELKKIVSIVI